MSVKPFQQLESAQQNSCVVNVKELSWAVDDKLILNNLSFEIYQNEFVGVIGPNGAGKSSLLRCIYGKNKLSAGKLFVHNLSIKEYSRNQLAKVLAVVLQEPPPKFEVSLFDLVRMGLIPHKPLLSFDNNDDKNAVTKAIEMVGLGDKLLQPFNSLSGGEKQRAMIARAILQKPQLLIMDEPTNHLDVKHQIEVLSMARDMGITVIVSIHDLNLATAFCDRLILLDEGKIVANGKPDDVLCHENLKQVFEVEAHIDNHPFIDKPRITFDLNPSVTLKREQGDPISAFGGNQS